MERKPVARSLTGTPATAARDYETANRAVARRAAAEGMVLLRNEGGLLPLDKAKPVALYGAGAVQTIKGGTGSGDVNARPTVSIWQGLQNAGWQITSEAWLTQYSREYAAARAAWLSSIWQKAEETGGADAMNLFDIYCATPFVIPAGAPPAEADPLTDTAIFVLARTAGEGADRQNAPGDYLLTDDEQNLLNAICLLYRHVILVINAGGLIDLGFLDAPLAAAIEAVLYISQPGMEAGNAFADILSGAVNPSAKLTDSWAMAYSDYPNALSFSHCNGNVEQEEYYEGLYVGYRYFDTFEVPVRYCFGYGLSYTQFRIGLTGIVRHDVGTERPSFGVRARVTNIGQVPGREVVQVYASCPQDGQEKEYRRLVSFLKTGLLQPGEFQDMEVWFPLAQLASFDESLPGWVMEPGQYILMAGSSLDDTQVAGILTADQALIFTKTGHICPPQQPLHELQQHETCVASIIGRRAAALAEAYATGAPEMHLRAADVLTKTVVYNGAYDNTPQEVRDFVDTLSTEQLILLCTGDIAKGQGMNEGRAEEDGSSQLGSAGTAVPGSAAQTSDCAAAQGLADIVLADGPAGLRLNREYQVVDGVPQAAPFLAALEGGYLLEGQEAATPAGETYYQYCTAFPVGTLLAQTWDPVVVREVGAAVSKELVEFGVTLWLAPGMNIHRNPLCGRNFEYYSEDPLLSGLMAAAMTDGVQATPGVGTTIKHFACNNQEDNRMGSNSILSERVLREIYLHGFEVCIAESQPMSIMTSYNLINGVHAANCYDTCTAVARNEWGFKGVIMTDWTTTMLGPDCTASGCLRAGNDLIMPGAPMDHDNIRQELDAGTLSMADLKRSVARLVNIVWQSRFTEVIPG